MQVTASTPPKKLRVATIQQPCYRNKKQSLQISESLIERAAQEGAQLVVLQELHTTDYFCQTEDHANFELAEPLQGDTFQHLSRIAKQWGIVLVGSIFERRSSAVYHNTALVIEKDGQLAGYYRKMHIPDDPGFYEKFYFTPGDTENSQKLAASGLQPITTSIGKLGVLVCWDQWFPEAARLMAMQGAEILIYPTAIGWDPTDTDQVQQQQLDAWMTIQRSHAIANGCYVLVSNRCGHEPDPSQASQGIQFWGNSFISGPQGELLQRSQSQEQEVNIAEIDLSYATHIRRVWPYFRDRRIDAYQGLEQRWIEQSD